jgi:two-component system, sensor histidine kinase and response regulator
MSYSILVIDDEPDNFEVIEALLASTGYTLHYANRGRDAIANLEKYDPDAILLDVMMPDLDGIQVCRRIKTMAQWQAVPIIMVTALASIADLSRCIEAGADDFVSKPINGVELRARIKSMLRIKKQHDKIESLSRLQRNNIHFLENSLNELRLDLAVSFPNELNAPLNDILDNIFLLQQNFHQLEGAEIEETLESINRSTIKLDKLSQSFLFYLQLALPTKSARKQEPCAARSIEQIAKRKIAQVYPLTKLTLNIEDAELAVTSKHLEYIINQLLESTLNIDDLEASINIHAHVMDGMFHFYVDNQEFEPDRTVNLELSKLIKFDGESTSGSEIGIGLKIVKKIIEVYDGLFLMTISKSQSDRLLTRSFAERLALSRAAGILPEETAKLRQQSETTIYITLPLARSISSELQSGDFFDGFESSGLLSGKLAKAEFSY